MTSPSDPRTVKPHPFLATLLSGPSSLDPSVYTLPRKVPPGGRVLHWKVAFGAGGGMMCSMEGRRALSTAMSPPGCCLALYLILFGALSSRILAVDGQA